VADPAPAGSRASERPAGEDRTDASRSVTSRTDTSRTGGGHADDGRTSGVRTEGRRTGENRPAWRRNGLRAIRRGTRRRSADGGRSVRRGTRTRSADGGPTIRRETRWRPSDGLRAIRRGTRRRPGDGGRAAEWAAALAAYRHLVVARIRADWQYRTSFLLFLAGQTVVASADFAAIAVIFTSVDELAGWSATEVAFLYGASGLAFGLGDLFVSPVEDASVHIKAGTFDRFLIRPVGALWQLLATEFAARRLGRSLQPLVVLVVAVAVADVHWTPATVALVPLTVVCGTVIYGSIWVLTSSFAFWTTETQEIGNSVTYGGNALTTYPIDVLGTWMRRIATFVVPLASVAYLPAVGLFDKPMPFGLPRAVAWSGPVVAATAALVARAIWGLGIRHYRSTGS
jgi:ABC-2 type transport system permease protein